MAFLGETSEEEPTFEDLRRVWRDPLWLDTSGHALDKAPHKAFLVFDDQAIHKISASKLQALTNPSVGNVIVVCELCFDIFDTERKTHGRYNDAFQLSGDKEQNRSIMRLSTQLRSMLGNPTKYGIHLQHVREYDTRVIREQNIAVRDIRSTGLFVACAAYFAQQAEQQKYDVDRVILVSDSPTLQKMAAQYHIPWCRSNNIFHYNERNS